MPQLSSVNTIIFDLDGTLRHSRPSSDEVLFRLAAQLGVPTPTNLRRQAARWAHYYWAQSDDLLTDTKIFGEHNQDFWANYLCRNLIALGCPDDKAVELSPSLQEQMAEQYQPESCVPADVTETLISLEEDGFTLGLISNRGDPITEELDELGLSPYFEFVYTAGEVNTWKPDPAIFAPALEKTGCPPERVVYIGDNYYADIIGARRAGLQSILIDPRGVFPNPECAVIHSVGELIDMLNFI
ncbi:MAG: HAD family hydrolase [Chloroflexota bacterium]|nr:HAD family hydrolase [Chloroflexota bacterium]